MSKREPTFWSRAALLGACLVAAACSTTGNTTEGSSAAKGDTNDDKSAVACASNDDCPGSMVCSPSLDLASAAPKRVQMTAPPPPCPFTACNETVACPDGQLCVSAAQALGQLGFPSSCAATVCGPPCETDESCPPGEVCRETGLCEVHRCDEADGPECPQAYVCEPQDPSAQANGCRRVRCDEQDGPACADGRICEPAAATSDLVGCRVLTCDEPGALECNALVSAPGDGLWACDPASATDASGCVPVPCGMSGGGCYSDSYVCSPTSSAGRNQGTDAYGCVRRNCEEGLDCFSPLYLPDADGQITQDPIDIGYCDHDGPNADLDGCADRHCSELERGCQIGQTCDADAPNADARGCRPLRCDEPESNGCGGNVCEPDHPRASVIGCRARMCEDLTGYECPEGTECNSRGTNANSMGCAPPGDPELVPVTPTASASPTSPPAPPAPDGTTPTNPNDNVGPLPGPSRDPTPTGTATPTPADGNGAGPSGVCVDGP